MQYEVISKVAEKTSWIPAVMPVFLTLLVVALCVIVIGGIVKDYRNNH